jgi:DNA-binding HxlR family transcriptional regulator
MLHSVPQSNAKPFLIHARVNLCPIQESGKILGKKWYLVIVHRLMGRKMGFNELKEAVGEISAKILAQALQDLQEKQIVDRRLASESPVRVEYSLTEKGQDLQNVLAGLELWGRKWDVCRDPRHHHVPFNATTPAAMNTESAAPPAGPQPPGPDGAATPA